MANQSTTVVIRGKTSYAKILGTPRLNYSKDGREWSTDIIVDATAKKQLKAVGVGDRIKSKDEYLDGQDYIGFRHRELNKEGKANRPIKVVDKDGVAWDESKLIGNGSIVDVKFDVVDYGKGMKKGMYIRAVRVLDLVPYETKEFAALSADDEFYAGNPEDVEAEVQPDEEEVVM